MVEPEFCPLLSLKKGEKELYPCLLEKCGWYHYTECGIKSIADSIPSSLAIVIDEMPSVHIVK